MWRKEGGKICAEVWQQVVFRGKTATLTVNYKIRMETLRWDFLDEAL